METSRILLLLGLVMLSVAGILAQDECGPDCFGQSPGALVEDPKNCSQYYICVGDNMPTDHAVPCNTGASFTTGDTLDSGCSGSLPCTASCEIPACHLTCNGTLDFISDHTNCSLYYTCQPGGAAGPFSCPSDRPVFDGENCIKDETKCCSALCTAYCQPGDVQVPDPADCHQYYICLQEGLPDEGLHFTCNSGDHFDVQQGRCVTGSECTPLCDEGMTGSPGGNTGVIGGNTTPPGGTTAGVTGGVTGGNTGVTGASTGVSGASTGVTGASTGVTGASTVVTVTPTSDCVTSYTCTATGEFPACQTCQSEFFHCGSASGAAELEKCPNDLVFNTDPKYPFCILPTNCPYSP